MPTDLASIENQRFGRLVAIEIDHFYSGKQYSRAIWKCVCDCGNVVNVRRDSLTGSRTRSCGCLSDEYNSKEKGHRTPFGHSSLNKLYHNYKSSAKQRNLKFELTKSEFKEIIEQDCVYCGSHPSSYYDAKGANGGILYNGIDRIDSSVGYIKGNIAPCCGICNRAKLDMSVKDFILWINQISDRHIKEEEIAYGNRVAS